MNISVSGLCYSYDAQEPVLKDVTTHFLTGELSFLSGATGSGKTTLMRCINGLIPHRFKRGRLSGSVLLDGQIAQGRSLMELSLRVGTVMQNPDRQMVATHAMDEIAFGPENLGLPPNDIRSRIERLAKDLSILDLMDRDISTLSEGEKQKVAIASILAKESGAVLLDEPLLSLDPWSSRKAMEYFRKLANKGIAVVVSEHRQQRVLEALPDRCIVLDRGRIAFDGTADKYPVSVPPERRRTGRPDILSPIMLAMEDVSFGYPGGAPALDHFDMQIHKGDIIAVMGANGAGKSTLCRHIIGLCKPMSGRVLLEGCDTREMTVAQIARQVGCVFQNPSAMFHEHTLRREISFGPRNLECSSAEIDFRVTRAAQEMGLDMHLDGSPFKLSFGEQKRASVACILAMCPRVLILDEPTAGQDSTNVIKLMDQLVPLRNLDALLFTTHDSDLAYAFANRCVVMDKGRIVRDGLPEEVLTDIGMLERCHLN